MGGCFGIGPCLWKIACIDLEKQASAVINSGLLLLCFVRERLTVMPI